MKKAQSNRSAPTQMRREYEFDYKKAQPNRFASRVRRRAVAVVLDPDVAEIFDTSERVNQLLRSVISSVSQRKTTVPRKRRRRAG